ncbi:hypothetical protein [Halogeometricum rufum]|nr:hypothetical protein [Halogeometricum rufum]
MSGATLVFEFDSPADEEQFIRDYLTEAWNRFETNEYWETGWFWRYRQFAEYESGPDGGLVRLVFDGDADELVEQEADRWDKHSGLASWRLLRYEDEEYESLFDQQTDTRGELGGEWEYRMKPLLSRFALAYYREFENTLPPVGEKSDENPLGLGFWSAFHNLMVQCGYNWYDETEVCQRAMKNRLKSIASYRGAEAAREEYQRLLDDWQAHHQELERWLNDNPTGQASEP